MLVFADPRASVPARGRESTSPLKFSMIIVIADVVIGVAVIVDT